MRSGTLTMPTSALTAVPGFLSASENALVSLIFASSIRLTLRSGYWLSVNIRLGMTKFFMVMPKPFMSPVPYMASPLYPFLIPGRVHVCKR